MSTLENIFAPGSRIVVRDAEWLVRRVDRTSTGGQALSVVGISELVRDKEAVFLTEIEKHIEILDPKETKLVPDTSSAYQTSLLYMESLLRQKVPTDDNLYIGHQAAMDPVPFQLDAAIQALHQPRQRILIADAVGLGKTLEAGVLMSELIRRGKGKRILVVAVKSMLTQFQKEMWTRFSIPLTRLDSIGIQRIRSRIPTNHNPFYYYDRAIISIDTLKNDREYSVYIENAYWDIIVIDEAHNVAERGHGTSQRARLAALLSSRSDTLIMLSATPHDGRARSFASLMNMLDPTAIANPDDYGPEDIKGLYIRRFKKDIQDQVETAFKPRKISVAHAKATEVEERAFDLFVDMEFSRLDQRKGGGKLFKTTLEKALFSSPAACLDTIRNRIRRLEKSEDPAYENDIALLKDLAYAVDRIDVESFSKYQRLIELIRDKNREFEWTGKDPLDRLIIFTERIETIKFLEKHLPKDLKLKDSQVEILHGGLPDIEQQAIVERFGKEQEPVRLLIASDVASEGINLHYLSHRMIHFDIPWSLMVFQQRNGRIDRYGQENTPEILYLITQSENEKIRGDTRILELLIQKDDQAVKNIGDPAAFMGVYDIDEEETLTASAIEQGQSPEEFESTVEESAFDPLAALLGDSQPPAGEAVPQNTSTMPSLFPDEYAYLKAALEHLKKAARMQVAFYDDEKRIDLTAPEDLQHRFKYMPREIWPENGQFILCTDQNVIQNEIKQSRKEETAWPRIDYLWPLNPVVGWVDDKLRAALGRHEAPILTLKGTLTPGEVVFIISGLIPNRKSHPMVHEWVGITFHEGKFHAIEDFEPLMDRAGLSRNRFPNPGQPPDVDALKALLPKAIDKAAQWMSEERKAFEKRINPKLNEHLNALERLRQKQHTQLEFRFAESRQPEKLVQGIRDRERRRIDRLFDDYLDWVEDTMTTEDNPYIQVIAVLRGAE
ncbi:MAG: DEAD/DEAH box helicase [Deltaproteobacteria bacterium]|nr:DEAD/DEAH box helicase [Deltaproteobacteria bacterium]